MKVVAQRLAVAGLRVAYGDLTFPSGGPMPLNITRQNNGQVTLQYDQEVSLKIYFSSLHLSASQVVYMGTGGFSVCKRAAHLCDETLSLKNWQTVPPDRVVQESISLEKTTILFLGAFCAGERQDAFNKNWSQQASRACLPLG